MALTQLQTLFCEHWIQTGNGTLSSRLAGYKGESDNVHAVNASRLLRNPKIRAYISKRYAEVAMDSNEVLGRLAKLARSSASNYVDKHGVVDWDKVKKDGYAIKSITHTKGKNSKVETEGRLKALELIGRVHGMYITKIAPTDPTGKKEYGADARSDLISKLLPELAIADTGGETGEAD